MLFRSKLEKCLKEISEGDLSFSIKLRGGDALHNVADSINLLVDQFRGLVGRSRDLSEVVHSRAKELQEGGFTESAQELLTKAEELDVLLAKFQISKLEDKEVDEVNPS